MSLQEPKPKKQKTVEDAVAEEDENGEQAPMPLRNDEGEAYFEISNKRRVTVREFKGKVLVDIREFYEKNDKMNPGSKGMALTLEQYEVLRDLIHQGAIDAAISEIQN